MDALLKLRNAAYSKPYRGQLEEIRRLVDTVYMTPRDGMWSVSYAVDPKPPGLFARVKTFLGYGLSGRG